MVVLPIFVLAESPEGLCVLEDIKVAFAARIKLIYLSVNLYHYEVFKVISVIFCSA